MEWSEFLTKSHDCSERIVWLIRQGFRLTRQAVYAGLLVFFVPSVLCDSDWSSHLTFDQIFNNTHYVHLQHRTPPYSSSKYNFVHLTSSPRYQNSPRYITNDSPTNKVKDTRFKVEDNLDNKYNVGSQNIVSDSQLTSNSGDFTGNELDYEEYDFPVNNNVGNEPKVPLLVGFSHDPFRYSVPEDDYLKGVRQMNPTSIMGKGENRGKRGVLHLYNMMYCATGCEPLAYKGYGCYCGFLGSGRPTDGIDRCCKMHDECYENIYCPFFTVYFQPYYWKCYRGQPLCARENYHTQHQFINGCAARLCECDRRFAMCVKKYPCPRRRALCRSSPIRLLQNLLMFR